MSGVTALPFTLMHASVYVVLSVMPVVVRDPDVPLQLLPLVPVTVQLAALLELQVMSAVLPLCTSEGFALSDVVASGAQRLFEGTDAEHEPEH